MIQRRERCVESLSRPSLQFVHAVAVQGLPCCRGLEQEKVEELWCSCLEGARNSIDRGVQHLVQSLETGKLGWRKKFGDRAAGEVRNGCLDDRDLFYRRRSRLGRHNRLLCIQQTCSRQRSQTLQYASSLHC